MAAISEHLELRAGLLAVDLAPDIGGSIARAGEHLLAGVREVVYRRSIPLATQHLAIVQSQGGERAAVFGAAIMVANEILSPARVDAYVAAHADR